MSAAASASASAGGGGGGAAAGGTAGAATAAADGCSLLLLCARCGLVLRDASGSWRSEVGEVHSGRCLYCFPLPSPEDIVEMRRLQVEEYRLRLERYRPPVAAAVMTAAAANIIPTNNNAPTAAAAVNVNVTGEIDETPRMAMRDAAAAAAAAQAMPVTPEQNDAPSVQAHAQAQAQAHVQARPRALLEDAATASAATGASADGNTTRSNGDEGDGTGTFCQQEEEEDAEEQQQQQQQHQEAEEPADADATIMAKAMQAQDSGDEASSNEDALADDDNIHATDTDAQLTMEDGEGHVNSIKNDNDNDNADQIAAVEDAASIQEAFAAQPKDDGEGEDEDDREDGDIGSGSDNEEEESQRKKSRHLDPKAVEIQNFIKEGSKESISLGQRDRKIEQLRVLIEKEEASGRQAECAETIIEMGAPRMVVFALNKVLASWATTKKSSRAHTSHATWAYECCHALATIAYHGTAEAIADASAIPAVVSALEFNAKLRNPNAKLYQRGCEALQNLSVCATGEILECEGGLDVVAHVLSEIMKKTGVGSRPKDPAKDTLRNIMNLLDNMSSSSQLLADDERDREDANRAKLLSRRGFLEPVLETITKFPDDIEVQLAACGAISSLCSAEENCIEVARMGGLRSLVVLSDRHPQSSELQKAIADCFGWLVADQDAIQLQACKDGVVDKCVRLLQQCTLYDDNASGLVHSALNVLDSISENYECKHALLDAKADLAVASIAKDAAFASSRDFERMCQSLLHRLRRDVVSI